VFLIRIVPSKNLHSSIFTPNIGLQSEGDLIETQTVQRGDQSALFAQTALIGQHAEPLTSEQVEELRKKIQEQLILIRKDTVSGDSASTWALLNTAVDGLARELTEQLRLVLEPSSATRLKGDYR